MTDIVNPDDFETAIGALVRGSVVPVAVEQRQWRKFDTEYYSHINDKPKKAT